MLLINPYLVILCDSIQIKSPVLESFILLNNVIYMPCATQEPYKQSEIRSTYEFST